MPQSKYSIIYEIELRAERLKAEIASAMKAVEASTASPKAIEYDVNRLKQIAVDRSASIKQLTRLQKQFTVEQIASSEEARNLVLNLRAGTFALQKIQVEAGKASTVARDLNTHFKSLSGYVGTPTQELHQLTTETKEATGAFAELASTARKAGVEVVRTGKAGRPVGAADTAKRERTSSGGYITARSVAEQIAGLHAQGELTTESLQSQQRLVEVMTKNFQISEKRTAALVSRVQEKLGDYLAEVEQAGGEARRVRARGMEQITIGLPPITTNPVQAAPDVMELVRRKRQLDTLETTFGQYIQPLFRAGARQSRADQLKSAMGMGGLDVKKLPAAVYFNEQGEVKVGTLQRSPRGAEAYRPVLPTGAGKAEMELFEIQLRQYAEFQKMANRILLSPEQLQPLSKTQVAAQRLSEAKRISKEQEIPAVEYETTAAGFRMYDQPVGASDLHRRRMEIALQLEGLQGLQDVESRHRHEAALLAKVEPRVMKAFEEFSFERTRLMREPAAGKEGVANILTMVGRTEANFNKFVGTYRDDYLRLVRNVTSPAAQLTSKQQIRRELSEVNRAIDEAVSAPAGPPIDPTSRAAFVREASTEALARRGSFVAEPSLYDQPQIRRGAERQAQALLRDVAQEIITREYPLRLPPGPPVLALPTGISRAAQLRQLPQWRGTLAPQMYGPTAPFPGLITPPRPSIAGEFTLAGSRAQGTARPGSDWDVVFTPEKALRLEADKLQAAQKYYAKAKTAAAQHYGVVESKVDFWVRATVAHRDFVEEQLIAPPKPGRARDWRMVDPEFLLTPPRGAALPGYDAGGEQAAAQARVVTQVQADFAAALAVEIAQKEAAVALAGRVTEAEQVREQLAAEAVGSAIRMIGARTQSEQNVAAANADLAQTTTVAARATRARIGIAGTQTQRIWEASRAIEMAEQRKVHADQRQRDKEEVVQTEKELEGVYRVGAGGERIPITAHVMPKAAARPRLTAAQVRAAPAAAAQEADTTAALQQQYGIPAAGAGAGGTGGGAPPRGPIVITTGGAGGAGGAGGGAPWDPWVYMDAGKYADEFGQALNRATMQYFGLRRLGYAMEWVGRSFEGAGQKILNTLAISSDAFREFDAAVTRAGAAMEAPIELHGELSRAALQASADIGLFSPTEIAEGMRQWAAGTGMVVKSEEEVNAMLADTIQIQYLAALGGEQLDSTMQAVGGTMAEFGMGLKDVNYISAVLNYVAAKSFATLSDVGQAFKMVGPLARDLGVAFEEVGAATGMLADANIRGSMAGRAQRMFFVRAVKPTGDYEENMNKVLASTLAVGQSWKDVVFPEGEYMGYAAHIDLLAAATENMTEAAKVEFLANVNTARSLPAITQLVSVQTEARKHGINAMRAYANIMIGVRDAETEAYKGFVEETTGIAWSVESATDLMEGQVDLLENALSTKLARIEQSWKAAAIAMGDAWGQTMSGPLESIADIAAGLTRLAAKFPFLGTILGGTGVALVGIGKLMGVAGTALGIAANYLIFQSAVAQFQLAVAQFGMRTMLDEITTRGVSRGGTTYEAFMGMTTKQRVEEYNKQYVVIPPAGLNKLQSVWKGVYAGAIAAGKVILPTIAISEALRLIVWEIGKKWDLGIPRAIEEKAQPYWDMGLLGIPAAMWDIGTQLPGSPAFGVPLPVGTIFEALGVSDKDIVDKYTFRGKHYADLTRKREEEVEAIRAGIPVGGIFESLPAPVMTSQLSVAQAMYEYKQQAFLEKANFEAEWKRRDADFNRDRIRTEKDFGRQVLRAQQSFDRQRLRAKEDLERQMADIDVSEARAFADLVEDRAEQEADIREQQHERLLNGEEDFQKSLRRLKEDYDDVMMEHIAKRDAIAILKEMKEYKKRRSRMIEDREDQKGDVRKDTQQSIDDLREDGEERREELKEQFVEQRADAVESFERQEADLQENFDLQAEQRQEDFERAQGERAIEYERSKEEARVAEEEKGRLQRMELLMHIGRVWGLMQTEEEYVRMHYANLLKQAQDFITNMSPLYARMSQMLSGSSGGSTENAWAFTSPTELSPTPMPWPIGHPPTGTVAGGQIGDWAPYGGSVAQPYGNWGWDLPGFASGGYASGPIMTGERGREFVLNTDTTRNLEQHLGPLTQGALTDALSIGGSTHHVFEFQGVPDHIDQESLEAVVVPIIEEVFAEVGRRVSR